MTRCRLPAVIVLASCAPSAPSPPALDVAPVIAPVTLRTLPYEPVVQKNPPFVTVCGSGDVMLGSNLDTAWARGAQRLTGSPTLLPSADALLAPLRPLVADADIVVVNVEGAIGDGPAPRKCRPGSTMCYAFRQEPAIARAFRRFADDAAVVGNVANNHAMDAGDEGFDRTLGELRAAGVQPSGADTLPALVPLVNGDTVAVLGFSVFAAGPDARDLEGVTRHVRRAAGRYPRVIVSLHMGGEGRGAQRTTDAPEEFAGEHRGNMVATAHAAVDAGAGLVVGHGPHVLRAMEWRGDALIAYSMGNLVTYGPFNRAPPLDRGGFVCAVLDPWGRVVSAEMRSTYQVSPGVAFPDSSRTAATIVDSLSALDFPTTGVRAVREELHRR